MTTAAEVDTILEALWDRTANTIQRVVLLAGESWTVPENLVGVRVQMIAKGGAGGAGGTTGGGGGGGAGQYVDRMIPADAWPSAGTVITAANVGPGNFALQGTGFLIFSLLGADGSAAVTTTGGAGGAGGGYVAITPGVGGAAGAAGGNCNVLEPVGAGGGGGGSAGANGGAGGITPNLNQDSVNYANGAGSSVNATRGDAGLGYGAGGGGGGGSSTGRGGGGAGGFVIPDSAGGAVGGTVTTAGGAGAPGVAVLTVYRGGV